MDIRCYETCILKNTHPIRKRICVIPKKHSAYTEKCPCRTCLLKGMCISACKPHYKFIDKGKEICLYIRVSHELILGWVK